MDASKYTPPLDPERALWAAGLDAEAREFFEERAAIREFGGGYSRAEAERQAEQETRAYLERCRKP